MRDIAIVTGVLVLKPIGKVDEGKIADNAIILDEDHINAEEDGE
jgi:hypothetical protein